MMVSRLVAGIEAGGTSFTVALAERDDPTTVVERVSIATTTPDETLAAVVAWLRGRHGRFDAIGVACFGPVELDRAAPLYGHITTTPKTRWRNADVVGALRELNVPVAFDTDVNAPALSEVRLGGHPRELHSLCYVTVGTGIGVGAVAHGQPVHGHLHPECGHVFARRHADDDFAGHCEFHGDACIEGMARLSALAARAGVTMAELPSLGDEHRVWNLAAHYIAQLCVTLCLTLCPQRIVVGGGLFNRECVLPLVRTHFKQLLAGYVRSPWVDDVDSYIVRSKFGPNAGIVGAPFSPKYHASAANA